MKKIVPIILLLPIVGCKDLKDPYKKEKPTYTKEQLEMKRKIDIKKAKIKIATTTVVKTDRDQKLRVKKEELKKYQKHLATRDQVKTEKTLAFLKKHEKKKQLVKKTEKELGKVNLKTERRKTLFYDEVKMLFPMKVGKLIMRNLQFESIPERPFLTTTTFEYRDQKQKIAFEILPYRDVYISNTQRGQKDFFYKSFKVGTLEIHMAINTRFEIINGAFTVDDTSWVFSGSGIKACDPILEIIKQFKIEQFLRLKKQYHNTEEE